MSECDSEREQTNETAAQQQEIRDTNVEFSHTHTLVAPVFFPAFIYLCSASADGLTPSSFPFPIFFWM
jgi:hypothetical protein